MAKKLTEEQQRRLFKQHFKIGEPVFFIWLGQQKYGYVIRTKEANWGIQYTVESENIRYPCGIEIKGSKTSYDTGCIYYEATKTIDRGELVRRAETGYNRIDPKLFGNTGRPAVQSGIDSAVCERGAVQDSEGDESTQTRVARKNAIKSSTNGVRKTNPRQRKDTELDSAIDRQKDFLNGFVKKD